MCGAIHRATRTSMTCATPRCSARSCAPGSVRTLKPVSRGSDLSDHAHTGNARVSANHDRPAHPGWNPRVSDASPGRSDVGVQPTVKPVDAPSEESEAGRGPRGKRGVLRPVAAVCGHGVGCAARRVAPLHRRARADRGRRGLEPEVDHSDSGRSRLRVNGLRTDQADSQAAANNPRAMAFKGSTSLSDDSRGLRG